MSCSGSDVKLKNTEGVHAIVKHTKLRFEHTVLFMGYILLYTIEILW